VVGFIIASAMITAQAQAPTAYSEYQVKAAQIYKFAKFVEWPSLSGTDLNRPVVVGILGEDPFGQDIEAVIGGKTADGRRLVIKRFPKLQSLGPCHILFVSSSQRNSLRQVFAAVKGSGVLTVGETDQFAQEGGVIQFVIDGGKVHLVINQAAAERAGVKISAKLLAMARVIRA